MGLIDNAILLSSTKYYSNMVLDTAKGIGTSVANAHGVNGWTDDEKIRGLYRLQGTEGSYDYKDRRRLKGTITRAKYGKKANYAAQDGDTAANVMSMMGKTKSQAHRMARTVGGISNMIRNQKKIENAGSYRYGRTLGKLGLGKRDFNYWDAGTKAIDLFKKGSKATDYRTRDSFKYMS